MILIVLALTVCVAAAAALCSLAFLDVAFHPPEYSAAQTPRNRSWPPPQEQDFVRWFSSTAESLTRSWLAARRSTNMASITPTVDREAPSGINGARGPVPVDGVGCSMTIGATPGEVLEIADYLRRTQPTDRVEKIRLQAAENSHRIGSMVDRASGVSGVRCPLACEDGTCVAFPVQPIQCRVRCALFGHEVVGDGDPIRTKLAADAVELGLSQALADVGLTGELYELNSALAKALPTPDETGQSAIKDDAFEECTVYPRALMR